MGEIIKVLNRVTIKDQEFAIELNKGTHPSGKYDIHLQNDDFRLNLNESDFIKMCSAIMYARENLSYYKEKENE